MVQRTADILPELYEADETAWLEAMAELIEQGRFAEIDYAHLGEYLADMARRDRREVESRLIVLLAHLLKWAHQAAKRTKSWRGTIVAQRQDLESELGRGVLWNHAEAVLDKAYAKAVERASAETELPAETFPAQCPYTLEQLLSPEILTENGGTTQNGGRQERKSQPKRRR
jgi:uncharacterized protein DUF29